MAEESWVFVERFGGHMRRVTLLDDDLRVIATHERGWGPDAPEPDDCQLLRAVEFDRAGVELELTE